MKTWEMLKEDERIPLTNEKQCYSAVKMSDRTLIVYEDVSASHDTIFIVKLPIDYSLCKWIDTSSEK